MSLNFDYTAMMPETVGNNGITSDDINGLNDIFAITYADLRDRYQAGTLPFFDLPFNKDTVSEICEFADEARGRFENFVLLGIGGSALGPIALHSALNHPQHNLSADRQGCRFFCPDNADPDLVGAVLDIVDPAKTLFNVVSKSGGTAETAAQFLIILDYLKERLGDKWREHLIFTTDPVNGLLRRFADEEGIKTFSIDPGVGGRFSVLTPVGLLPAAITGIDIAELCAGAGAMKEACFRDKLEGNPAALLAGLFYLAHQRKARPIHVIFAYSNRLYPIADWFRQLWAESLGKRYSTDGREIFTGPTPVKAIGATDQHSQVQLYVEGPQDKVFLILGTKQFGREQPIPPLRSQGGVREGRLSQTEYPEISYLGGSDLGDLLNTERQATIYALTQAYRLNMTIEMDKIDPRHIGALIYLLEVVVLYAGGFYNVNPLDQPGVEAGKSATYALMGRSGYEDQRDRIAAFFDSDSKIIKLTV